jgi:hypothetical protein
MNIYTVRDNLISTIAGKEDLLTNLKSKRIPPEVSIHYLEINIDELKRILADVEVCCTQYSEMGWALNPERMGQ